MHWRHEQLSLRILAAASHHSFDRVHAEYAAPRSQRTGTRAGEGEVFELRVVPRGQNTPHLGKRPEPFEEVSEPQAGIRRHTGVGYELVLDPVVPQMVEHLVEVFSLPALARACRVSFVSAPRQQCPDRPAQVFECFSPAPAVFQALVPTVEYPAPAPAVSESPAPVLRSASHTQSGFISCSSGGEY